MQMTVLMAFALVLVLGTSRDPLLIHAPGPLLLTAVAAYWVVSAGLSATVSAVSLRRLRSNTVSMTAASRVYQRLSLLVQAWLLMGLVGLIGLGIMDQLASSWPLARVGPVRDGRVQVIQELLVLAVFLVALVLHWLTAYRFEHALRMQVEQELILAGRPVRPGWTLRQFLDFHFRHQFLFVALPVVLIMLSRDLVALLNVPPRWEWIKSFATAAAVGVVFIASPALLVHVWRTRPMADGELRRRIERLCATLNLRYRQLRIWDTAGVIANAGVMGLHRHLRYVLVTDALLENMDDAQIVAVFGHEAGHIKHHHLGYFLVFTLAAMALSLAAVSAVMTLLPATTSPRQVELVQMGISLGTIVLIWGVGFGWLSRRFERQADVYGAWCAGLDVAGGGGENPLAAGAPTFVTALENVGLLNGMSRTARNWRHGSIASRVAFLKNWTVAGYSRFAFDQSIARIKAILWLVLLAGGIVAALTYRIWLTT